MSQDNRLEHYFSGKLLQPSLNDRQFRKVEEGRSQTFPASQHYGREENVAVGSIFWIENDGAKDVWSEMRKCRQQQSEEKIQIEKEGPSSKIPEGEVEKSVFWVEDDGGKDVFKAIRERRNRMKKSKQKREEAPSDPPLE